MEIAVNETVNAILPLLKASGLFVLISDILSFFIKIYADVYRQNKEKTEYIKILKADFPLIKAFLNRIKTYTIAKYALSGGVFYVAFLFGLVVEYLLAIIIVKVLGNIVSIDYIATFFYLSPNNEDSIMLALNAITLYSSCLNVSFLLFFVICVWWNNSTILKKFSTPLLTETGLIRPSAYLVFLSYWSLIGIIFAANFLVYLLLYGNLLKASEIYDNFLSNSMNFTDIYSLFEANVPYLVCYIAVHLSGLLISFALISGLYFSARIFYEKLIESTTQFYKNDFPYIKVKTECGDIEGQLSEIQNKSFLILSEKEVLNIIRWDKIKIMKVSHIIKNDL